MLAIIYILQSNNYIQKSNDQGKSIDVRLYNICIFKQTFKKNIFISWTFILLHSHYSYLEQSSLGNNKEIMSNKIVLQKLQVYSVNCRPCLLANVEHTQYFMLSNLLHRRNLANSKAYIQWWTFNFFNAIFILLVEEKCSMLMVSWWWW